MWMLVYLATMRTEESTALESEVEKSTVEEGIEAGSCEDNIR